MVTDRVHLQDWLQLIRAEYEKASRSPTHAARSVLAPVEPAAPTAVVGIGSNTHDSSRSSVYTRSLRRAFSANVVVAGNKFAPRFFHGRNCLSSRQSRLNRRSP